jgi:hypothetical protein
MRCKFLQPGRQPALVREEIQHQSAMAGDEALGFAA